MQLTIKAAPWIAAQRAAREAGNDDPALIVREAVKWIASVDPDQPVFAYLHFMGPHNPYRPPLPYALAMSAEAPVERLVDPPHNWDGRDALSEADRRQMIAQYDGEVLWHDDYFGKLLDQLRQLGRLDDAVVVVLADHGESFGTHDSWGHQAGLFDSVVQIPLVFWRSADTQQRDRRIGVPVSLLDVAPTLIDLAGAPAPATFEGRSLVPWLRGEVPASTVVFSENPTHDEVGAWDEKWAYFRGEMKDGSGHWLHRDWLYRADDPQQNDEVSAQHPDVVAAMRAEAERQVASSRAQARESSRSRWIPSGASSSARSATWTRGSSPEHSERDPPLAGPRRSRCCLPQGDGAHQSVR